MNSVCPIFEFWTRFVNFWILNTALNFEPRLSNFWTRFVQFWILNPVCPISEFLTKFVQFWILNPVCTISEFLTRFVPFWIVNPVCPISDFWTRFVQFWIMKAVGRFVWILNPLCPIRSDAWISKWQLIFMPLLGSKGAAANRKTSGEGGQDENHGPCLSDFWILN